MFKKILNSQFNSIASAAMVIAAASFISKVLGLLRDRLLAGTFGTGPESDIYFAAFRIPDLIYYLVILGAVSAGLIPVFIDYLNKDKQKAWYLINSLLNIISLIVVAACIVLILVSPWLTKLIVPGFKGKELAMTVSLAQLMFLSPFFMGLGAIFGGVIQSFRKFICYSLAPILYNLGIISGVLFFYPYFKQFQTQGSPYIGLYGLGFGVILGAFLNFLIQWFDAKTCGYKWQWVFDWKFEGVKRIFQVMPGRFLGLTLNQINIVIITAMASYLAVGSISVYNYASNIWAVPLGIFGIAFVTASFPKLSEQAQKKQVLSFVKTFTYTASQILYFILPATAFFIVLRAQIVRLILGVGQFDWIATINTLDTLAYFCLGLFAEALVWLFIRAFFAWEDSKTPFYLGAVSTIVRIIAAWIFASNFNMGVAGLALGYSLGSILNLILLFVALSEKLRFLAKDDEQNISKAENQFIITGFKMAIASFFSGLLAYCFLYLIDPYVDLSTGLGLLTQASIAGIFGLLFYFIFSWILQIKENSIFFQSLFSCWPLSKLPSTFIDLNGK